MLTECGFDRFTSDLTFAYGSNWSIYIRSTNTQKLILRDGFQFCVSFQVYPAKYVILLIQLYKFTYQQKNKKKFTNLQVWVSFGFCLSLDMRHRNYVMSIGAWRMIHFSSWYYSSESFGQRTNLNMNLISFTWNLLYASSLKYFWYKVWIKWYT